MNIFCDFHHAGLLNSLIMLFERRLGGMIYRPIGTEWYKRGFWKVYDHPATVEQFLGIGGATPDGTPKLNEVIDQGPPGVYACHDIDSGYTNRGVTFEYFCKMPFDYVIASMPHHIEPFKRLVAEYKPTAKLIYQIGNAWTIEAGLAPNVMASAIINDVPPNINFISYHQEFDLDIFRPQPDTPNNVITCLINAYNTEPHFANDWWLFRETEAMTNGGWIWKSYGGQCRDGSRDGALEVAKAIAGSRFIWHVKNGGDGYGHIIHNAYAMGIPPIVKMSYYQGKLAGQLMVDGETCINIDDLCPRKIIDKIAYYNQPELYQRMRQNVYNVFKARVDFNQEQTQIEAFLGKCI